MAKRSWPFGVTSWDDTVKFAQLLFGVDVAFENYAERLPHRSNKSFLLFAKGACAEGRPFFEIGDFIAPQLEEIQQWEENVRNNNARPTKSQQMLKADGWTVYYWSAQVTRAPCLCRSNLWSWRSPETRANFIGHVESWKQIWEIMGRHIDEELWSFSESRPASHLAWQVMAGVVELEWSQQKSWNQPSFRWVCHLQQCWSDHVLFLWAWGCVDLGPQKRSSDKDVVPRRRWRFGDGRRLPSRVLPWCAGALHLERFEVASYVHYNARVGESWAAAGNCFAWRCWLICANMSYCLLVSCSQFAQQAFGLEDKRARDETTLAA